MDILFARGLGLAALVGVSACNIVTDAATRLAADIERGASLLKQEPGARHTIAHRTPSKSNECVGPYKVQLDRVGALIVWCNDASGRTVTSHSTSSHARFVDTPETYIVEKAAGTTLLIDLEMRSSRAVIAAVR